MSDTAGTLPRGVHIVDAMKGPLVGEGRYRRMLPFAVTATLGLAIAVPATSWTRPGLAIAATILVAVTIVGALTFPWHRVRRHAQFFPPFLFLVGSPKRRRDPPEKSGRKPLLTPSVSRHSDVCEFSGFNRRRTE